MQIQLDRLKIQIQMQIQVDRLKIQIQTQIQVERVEIKDVRLPVQLQRAMAAEAEAAREARAKVGLIIYNTYIDLEKVGW